MARRSRKRNIRGVSIPPESIAVGKCYLARGEKVLQVRHVVPAMPEGRAQCEGRVRRTGPKPGWVLVLSGGRAFAAAVVREVPCDLAPEQEG